MSSVRFDPDNALTSNGGGRAEVEEPDSSTEPEPVGAIAERVLIDLARGRDPHLAARQHEALNRLTRAHRPKEQKP